MALILKFSQAMIYEMDYKSYLIKDAIKRFTEELDQIAAMRIPGSVPASGTRVRIYDRTTGTAYDAIVDSADSTDPTQCWVFTDFPGGAATWDINQARMETTMGWRRSGEHGVPKKQKVSLLDILLT